MRRGGRDIRYQITWTTLSDYLRALERRGVSQNLASFIGATTIREHVIALEDRQATPEQMEQMPALVRQEMGGRSACNRILVDLRAGVLREHRGADRTV